MPGAATSSAPLRRLLGGPRGTERAAWTLLALPVSRPGWPPQSGTAAYLIAGTIMWKKIFVVACVLMFLMAGGGVFVTLRAPHPRGRSGDTQPPALSGDAPGAGLPAEGTTVPPPS